MVMNAQRRFRSTGNGGPATGILTVSPCLPSPALEMPDLVSRIFSFLDQNTLITSTSLVCRLWFNASQELLDYHLQLRTYKSGAWISFPERLPFAKSLTVGPQQGPWREPTSGRGTKQWNKKVMPLVCGSLQNDKYNRLRKASLDMPPGTKTVPFEQILIQCPELSSLSLRSNCPSFPQEHRGSSGSSHGAPAFMMRLKRLVSRGAPSSSPPPLLPTNFNCTVPLPLTSLHLDSLRFSPQAFLSFVPFLKNLTKLSLLNVQDPWDPAAIIAAVNATPTHLLAMGAGGATHPGPFPPDCGGEQRATFWRTVSRHCPNLTRIRFGCHGKVAVTEYSAMPLEMFPSVSAWGVDYRCIQASSSTWNALPLRAMANQLTSLEILGGPTVGYQGSLPNRNRDLLLWKLLCASPSLEHFKATHVPLSTKVLWGDHAFSDTGVFQVTAATQMWNCRGLKTLALSLDTQEEEGMSMEEIDISTRRIFGYLGRVCPRLQDLTLVVSCRLYAMESGICLLTRLQHLRRLAIYSSLSDQGGSTLTPHQKGLFVWMQGIVYNRGRVAVFGPWLRGPRRLYEEYKYFLDVVQWWSSTVDVGGRSRMEIEERRHRMQRQIEHNNYRSSSEEPDLLLSSRDLPVVDGLVDMEFCGSVLDMEALLLARRDRFQKEAERHEDLTDQWQGAASGSEGAQTWPCLEQILLSSGSLDKDDLESIGNQADLAQRIMSELRPDVKVICQYSKHPHLLLDL